MFNVKCDENNEESRIQKDPIKMIWNLICLASDILLSKTKTNRVFFIVIFSSVYVTKSAFELLVLEFMLEPLFYWFYKPSSLAARFFLLFIVVVAFWHNFNFTFYSFSERNENFYDFICNIECRQTKEQSRVLWHCMAICVYAMELQKYTLIKVNCTRTKIEFHSSLTFGFFLARSGKHYLKLN